MILVDWKSEKKLLDFGVWVGRGVTDRCQMLLILVEFLEIGLVVVAVVTCWLRDRIRVEDVKIVKLGSYYVQILFKEKYIIFSFNCLQNV